MRRLRLVFSLLVLSISVGACAGNDDQDGAAGVDRPAGWSEATHSKDAAPNYDVLFAMDKVHTLEISISPSDYQSMQDDLADIMADSGGFPGGGVPPGEGGLPPDCAPPADGGTPPADGAFPPGCELPPIGDGGPVSILSRDPMYVPVEVGFGDHTWWHVGMRYKGNSSLASGFSAGNGKLPFRLDFDQFEDQHPEIENQRFYGFKKLTFSSNWNDDSLIREVYVSELLRDRGIPAARTAFYRVVVDVGNGPQYWGLYTMIEDPADGAMLDAQMGGQGGNLYKPEGTGADWTVFDPAGFEKKTNEEAADWSDVQAAISALHADSTSDPAAWRAAFEATFDVDRFLSWLAVNTTIQNWDSYGSMAHNYYLYASPGTTQLRWIPWDHNLSMMQGLGPGGGGLGPGGPTGATETDAVTEVLHAAVSDNWPLISRLLADPVYQQRYREQLEHALSGLFDVEVGPARMRALHELIQPFVVGPEGEQPGYTHLSSEEAFLESIDGSQGLAAHVEARHARVQEALGY